MRKHFVHNREAGPIGKERADGGQEFSGATCALQENGSTFCKMSVYVVRLERGSSKDSDSGMFDGVSRKYTGFETPSLARLSLSGHVLG